MPDLDPTLALAVSGIGVWSWDAHADQVVGDSTFAELLSIVDSDQPWSADVLKAAIVPADWGRLQTAHDQALAGGADIACSVQTTADPSRWLSMRGAVTPQGDSGQAAILTGVIWDSSDEKARVDRLTILASEMDHRVKNAFAVIRALINQAVHTSPDHAGFGASLKAQVSAMATAHAVSARFARETENAQTPVPLAAVLKTSLAPWRGGHDIRETVPDDLLLAPQEVAAVAMVIYELSTNAAKYGALGERGGRLSIAARVMADGCRQLTWEEACAAPLLEQSDAARSDQGFGTVLLEHCAATLNAKISRDISDAGLIVQLVLRPRGS